MRGRIGASAAKVADGGDKRWISGCTHGGDDDDGNNAPELAAPQDRATRVSQLDAR